MKYAILIYSNETVTADQSEAERGEIFAGYKALTGAMQAQEGLMLGGEALEPSSTATSVQMRNGKVLHTDGPFAETKEQLGGFYLLDCKDLDEALAWAAKIPTAKHGTIEVRPVMNIG